LTLLASVLFLGASATAQDLQLDATIDGDNYSAVFTDFNSPEAPLSGDYSDGREGQSGWYWERAGADIEVYNKDDELVCTYEDAATSASEGTIDDGPSSGNNGGSWTRPE
jgi:hypothetical protein